MNRGRSVVVSTAATLAAAVLWAWLVRAAIRAGQQARARDDAGQWLLVLAAGLGAVLALYAGLVMATRAVAVLRGETRRPYRGRHGR